MLIAIIVMFALAACLGLLLLTYVLRGKETPKLVVLMHGPIAASALFLLIAYAYLKESATTSIVCFCIAALGGFVLVYKDLTHKPMPKWLALLHGTLALMGFIFLILFAIR